MYFETLIGQMKPFFEELGYTLSGDGSFVKEDKAFTVEYDSEKEIYNLYSEVSGERRKISAYLFTADQTEKDVESVTIDFTDTVKKELSLNTRKRNVSEVALPQKDTGDTVTVSGYAQKMLAIFPDLKDIYRDEVALYGKFLAVEFTKNYFIPSAVELYKAGNRKSVRKFTETVCEMYIAADSGTGAICVSLLGAVMYLEPSLSDTIKENCDRCPSLYVAVLNFSRRLKKNKKLRESLIK